MNRNYKRIGQLEQQIKDLNGRHDGLSGKVQALEKKAERQLRPAVIARKVSCGNKTPNGARTWEILTSLAATCAQRAQSFAQLVSRAAALSYTRQTHTRAMRESNFFHDFGNDVTPFIFATFIPAS